MYRCAQCWSVVRLTVGHVTTSACTPGLIANIDLVRNPPPCPLPSHCRSVPPRADFSPLGFSDYYDCARIRIRGGAPLTSAHQPVFRPGGSVPETGENRDRCLAHVNGVNMNQREQMKMMKVCKRASAPGLGLALTFYARSVLANTARAPRPVLAPRPPHNLSNC